MREGNLIFLNQKFVGGFMRKLVFCLLAFVLFLSPKSSLAFNSDSPDGPYGQNGEIYNGNFEWGNLGWWYGYGGNRYTSADPNMRHGGTYGAVIQTQGTTASIAQDMGLVPQRHYYLQAWVKTSNGNATNLGLCSNSGCNVCANPASTNWSQYTCLVQATSDSWHSVGLGSYSNNSWVATDDWSFSAVEYQTTATEFCLPGSEKYGCNRVRYYDGVSKWIVGRDYKGGTGTYGAGTWRLEYTKDWIESNGVVNFSQQFGPSPWFDAPFDSRDSQWRTFNTTGYLPAGAIVTFKYAYTSPGVPTWCSGMFVHYVTAGYVNYQSESTQCWQ